MGGIQRDTYFLIICALAVLAAFHLLMLFIFWKKKFTRGSGVYWGLLFSLLGGAAFAVHWFIYIESTGPVGAGVGIYISPIFTLYAVVISFFLGWSLHQTIRFLYAILTKKVMPFSKIRFVLAVLLLMFCVFISQKYIRSYIPDDYGLVAVPELNFTNSIGMDMVRTSAGYWVGKYEVTQSQFEKVMEFNPLAKYEESYRQYGDPNKPVIAVSRKESSDFCEKLTFVERKAKALPDGYRYSLPTEKQWRAYVADARLEDSVIPVNSHIDSLSRVGSLKPNRLGLYDVRGNVDEYCINQFSKDVKDIVLRGASWNSHGKEHQLIDNRAGLAGDHTGKESRGISAGFRVVLIKASNSESQKP